MVEVGQDAVIYKGQDETIRFTIPEDVTGWTYEYTVRDTHNADAAVITKTSGFTVSAGATSTVDVSLSTTDTNITEDLYDHALWRTNAGSTKPLAVGTLKVNQSSHTT